MTGKCNLQWLDENTDTLIPVCECMFNKKGILYQVGTIFDDKLLPVICHNSTNLTRSLSDWIRIRDRWKLRPDFKGNDIAITKKNDYRSPFDNYSFVSSDFPNGDVYTSKEALNYPLKKECYIDGICVYSREVNKDSLLYRLCSEAELHHVFEPGTYEIIRQGKQDVLCWKTRIEQGYEYIPFIEYVKPFIIQGVSKAEAVVRCCKYYQIPGWQELFFELCSIDGIVEIEKDLDSLFVMRDKKDTTKVCGFMLF